MSKDSKSPKALTPQGRAVLGRVGANIRAARMRRNMTQAELARRALTSHTTLMRLERGEPTVGVGVLVQVLDVLGLLGSLEAVASPATDATGLALQEGRGRQRARSRAPRKDELDF